MNLNNKLSGKIEVLKSKNLYRECKIHDSKLINFGSNDYLGLAKQKTSLDLDSIGSTGSRLITGTHQEHVDLEEAIANWKQTEAALFYSSGYQANLGTISALVGPGDLVLSDEYNHACILDGIRLSGAAKFFYRHNDIEHLEELLSKYSNQYENVFVITDTIFSMDGDRARLKEIASLKQKYSFYIYVDEAHATGVLGESGSGLVSELELKKQVDVQMGTFSKALGVEGAYIAGSKTLIEYLINKSKTFIYSTAPSPIVAKLIKRNLEILMSSTGDQLREKLASNIKYFSQLLSKEKITFINEATTIFIIPYEDISSAVNKSKLLQSKGFLVTAIRPPTVSFPRLRICITAKHSQEELENLSNCLL